MITFVLYIIQFILVGYMQQDVRALKSDAVQDTLDHWNISYALQFQRFPLPPPVEEIVTKPYFITKGWNSPKRENPNFIRDRKREFSKPEMPPSWGSRYRQLYNPAWMDYCDVYHCNDYHKQACGLNRRNMKFKWFQSVCHLMLNNQCSNFRGTLKYDTVETKFCHMYVMFLRQGCPHLNDCSDDLDPVCAMSSKDSHIVLFKNQCYMDAVNCRNSTLQEYDAVYMDFCDRRKSQYNTRQIQID